jgi:adhesin HecA-like repeat protein
MTINVNGGALEALMPNATAIDWDGGDDLSTPATIVNINGGTINVPKGMAAVGDVTVNAGTGLTGMVINLHDLKFKLYGNCTLRTTMSDDNGNPMIIGGILWETDSKATVELESGVSWIIHDSWTFTNYGTLNIYGHVTNKEKIINHGIINNYSGNSLENQGMIDNRGTINIKSTGKTINTGTIDNTSGTINNEGGTFQSVQTASEMGGTVSGEVQPLNSNTSYSGDGCNAGLGVAGLLLAGFAALKQRKE